MKSIIQGVPNDIKPKYPCLKVYRSPGGDTTYDKVVLFFEPEKGLVVHAFGYGNYIGEYAVDWGEEYFELFDGTIELSN